MGKELARAPESLFWYWISERHAIYLRRKRGDPKPWTTDPILRDYKFTNPFRENDRGTVWLRENFLDPHRDGDTGLLAFNICWYRMFNWTGTGELLGWRESWPNYEIKSILVNALGRKEQVFTGAHIVYSPPGFSKIESITDVCSALWELRDKLANTARRERRLQAVFDELQEVHCVGGFMGYEMVTDMRHTRLLDDATDIMTWANPGPGARRGLQRLGMTYKGDAAIGSMRTLLGKRLAGLDYLGLGILREEDRYDPSQLEMRDIEHSLCEFDKYCRVKFGEGEPRSKFPGGVE